MYFQDASHSSVDPLWKHPHRHILNLMEPATEISHHRYRTEEPPVSVRDHTTLTRTEQEFLKPVFAEFNEKLLEDEYYVQAFFTKTIL